MVQLEKCNEVFHFQESMVLLRQRCFYKSQLQSLQALSSEV